MSTFLKKHDTSIVIIFNSDFTEIKYASEKCYVLFTMTNSSDGKNIHLRKKHLSFEKIKGDQEHFKIQKSLQKEPKTPLFPSTD